MSTRDPSFLTPHPGPPTLQFPTELKQLPQWCVHREGVPHQVSGAKARTNDPATFCTYPDALRAKRSFDGISFIVTADCPYTGIDLDDCIADDGSIKPAFKPIVEFLQRHGAYLAYSRHSRGIHAIIRGKKPTNSPCKKSFTRGTREAVEIYDKAKALALTGKPFGTPAETIGGDDSTVAELVKMIFGADTLCDQFAKSLLAERHAEPRADADVLAAASKRFGAKFDKLTEGDWEADYASQSEADLEYCKMLAAETRDPAQIARLVEASGLSRDKWTRRSDYRTSTIQKAIEWAEAHPASSPLKAPRRKLDAGGLQALVADCHFFLHNGNPCVTYRSARGRWVVQEVDSREFGNEILRRQYAQSGTAPTAEETKQIQRMLDAKTRNEGEEEPVYRRIAWVENNTKLLIDSCDSDNRIFVVTAAGIQVIKPDRPPVHFAKGEYDGPLPVPDLTGDISELRPFLNVDVPYFRLAVAALIGAYMPLGQIAPLVLTGPRGTGKSKTAELIQRLRDPQVHPAGQEESEASLPRSEKDMAVAAASCGGVLSYGNLSAMSADQADRLCRMVGGGRLDSRALYTNSGLCRLDARVFLILHGISDEMFRRDDFRERAVLLQLRPFGPEHPRKSETLFYADFEAARPRIFGAILKAVSAAIRNLPNVPDETGFRMGAFVRWVVAAEPACGWPLGSIVAAYQRDRQQADELVLSDDLIAQGIIRLVERRSEPWKGTSSDLLAELERPAAGVCRLPRQLAENPAAIGKHLSRLAGSLQSVGIFHTTRREGKARQRVHYFSRQPLNLPPSR